MDVGLFVPIGNGNANPEVVRAIGRESEARGFESIWVAEHVVLFEDYQSQYPYDESGKFPGGVDSGILEPLTALTYLAAVTDTIRLGTGICLVAQRNPVYTAKQVTDIDNLSGGRARPRPHGHAAVPAELAAAAARGLARAVGRGDLA